MANAAATVKTPFRVTADSIEACSCRHGCNCQFGGFPNEGICEFIIGYRVKTGHFGDVSLDGVQAVFLAKYPNAIHEGHGRAALFIDQAATPGQTSAFSTIVSGRMGGMPWEALAGTIERFDGPFQAPIQISVAGERSRVEVAGAIDLQLEPLTNPATGVAKEVHITYPRGGFFWNDGRIATSATMRSVYEDLRFEWPHRYAAEAEVNWTNL